MRLVETDDPWVPPELTDEEVLVVVSLTEFAGLSNSITEALLAVDDWEFSSLVGLLPDEAKRLRGQIHDILQSRPAPG